MNKKHIYIVLLGLWLSPLISLASSHSFVDIQTSRGVITLELADDAATGYGKQFFKLYA